MSGDRRRRKCECGSAACPDPDGHGPQLTCHPKGTLDKEARKAKLKEGNTWVRRAFAKGDATRAAIHKLTNGRPIRLSAGHWDRPGLERLGAGVRLRTVAGERSLPINSNAMRAPSEPQYANLADILQYPRTLTPVPKRSRSSSGRLKCECGAGEEACPTDLRTAGAKVAAFDPDWGGDEAAVHAAWVAAWAKLQPIDATLVTRLAASQMPIAVRHYEEHQLRRRRCQGGNEQWYVPRARACATQARACLVSPAM